MFRLKKYKCIKETPLRQYKGIFRRPISLFEGIALILGGTIGAGVLGVPYAVAKVGILIGVLYIIGIGMLMMGMNLLVGSVAVRTRRNLQLVGFARKYLGKWGGWTMMLLVYITSFAILVVYVIGEGQTLSALLGGSPFAWSLIFWALGSLFIVVGMHTIKTIELLLTLSILAVIFIIVFISAPHIEIIHLEYTNLANLLLPYGVILFAFSGASTIPEAHSILEKRKSAFKKAIIISGIISIAVYVLFAFIVVGVTGLETTEIATIGLGNKINKEILILGNIFAFLAMGTSFLMAGLALRDSLRWDFKLSYGLSTFITCSVPLALFIVGVRGFIAAIDVVGGIFMSSQMLLLIFIYWAAKQKGDLKVGKYKLHHTILLIALLVLAFTFGAVYSVIKLF